MQTSQEVINIFTALCECKKDFVPLQKNKQGYGYKYVTLDVVIDMLNSVLPKHGLGFVQFPSMNGDNYSLTTRVFHTSGEWIEDTITFSLTEISKANDTQKLGASVTYFRRYTLTSIFGIAADEDVDGNVETAIEMQSSRKSFNEQNRQQKNYDQQSNYNSSSIENLVESQNEFSKEMINGLYLTTDSSLNEELKQLTSEKYMDEFVLTEKTKSFINDKVDKGAFSKKEDYINYIKRACTINKQKIASKAEEKQDDESKTESVSI